MATARAPGPHAVPVVFSLALAETQMGEMLCVVGEGDAMGNWDPQRAIPLTTGPATYPRWSSTIVWIPCEDPAAPLTLQYKYIRDCRQVGRSMYWEDRICNRTVTVPGPDYTTAARAFGVSPAQGPVVWVVGDLQWDRPDASPPCLLDMTCVSGSALTSTGSRGLLATPRRPEVPQADRDGRPVPPMKGPIPQPAEGMDDVDDMSGFAPEESSARRDRDQPEWGGDSGDVIMIGDLNFFTPSARRRTPSRGTPVMLSPASSASMMQRLVSTSLLPEVDDEVFHSQEEDQSMVREQSASSLQNLVAGSDSSLLRVSSECSCGSSMRRGRSSSLLPDLFDEADDRSAEAPGSASGSPQTFEDVYTVVGDEPIGEGSFGLVWNCLRKSVARGGDDKMRAVKRISKSRLQPRDVRNLFGHGQSEGEIRMHLRLKHVHIVAMHEVFDDVGIVSLVMECCRGGDLFDIITDHAARHNTGLSEAASARVLRHLLRALKFLHENCIVHRDVKCENVLLHEHGVPIEAGTFKLCDFGFAAVERSDAGRHLRSRLGSPDAVAPEVVKGEEYSTPVDLWAAGVLLFMSLSATPPFWASSDVGVLQRVRTGQYCFSHVRWERISVEAKHVVQQLLTFTPWDRPTAVQALELLWVGSRRKGRGRAP